MAELAAHSLLEENTPAQYREITVRECRNLGMLRVQYLESEATNELARLVDLALPKAGEYTESGRLRLHWLTPNEYLVVTEPDAENAVLKTLSTLQQSNTSHVSVLSDARITLEVSGERVADLLAQGCSLDLHPSRFGVGRSTVTRFALLPLMLSKTGDNCFELTVDRACGRYLWDWIVDAIDGL